MLKRLRSLVWLVGMALAGVAVYQELQKPPQERTWHGKVAGFVPYDFRRPTLQRFRDAFWNPNSDRLFTDRVLGVGWAVNFYRLFELARMACRSSRTA